MNVYSNHKLEEKVLVYFLKDLSEDKYNNLVKSFVNFKLPKLINPIALQCLIRHKQEGHKIIIISASLSEYVGMWANSIGVKDISCTNLVRVSGCITGRILGDNCYGKVKLKRLVDILGSLDKYELYVYGDSKGDFDILNIADYPFYGKFRM